MNSQGSNDVSPEAMQARIQQARREAETLKDRIKRKKDELADTTRESAPFPIARRHHEMPSQLAPDPSIRRLDVTRILIIDPFRHSPHRRPAGPRADPQEPTDEG